MEKNGEKIRNLKVGYFVLWQQNKTKGNTT